MVTQSPPRPAWQQKLTAELAGHIDSYACAGAAGAKAEHSVRVRLDCRTGLIIGKKKQQNNNKNNNNNTKTTKNLWTLHL